MEARVGSGKFRLKMCSKSGKFSAEIGIQFVKLSLKMLSVRTDYADGHIGSPILQLLHMIIFSVDESGKSVVKLEGKSGEIIYVGCCFPPKLANSGTLMHNGAAAGISATREVSHSSLHF